MRFYTDSRTTIHATELITSCRLSTRVLKSTLERVTVEPGAGEPCECVNAWGGRDADVTEAEPVAFGFAYDLGDREVFIDCRASVDGDSLTVCRAVNDDGLDTVSSKAVARKIITAARVVWLAYADRMARTVQ